MSGLLKVTTPAASEDLTTLATVKAELNITTLDRDDDLQRYISDASAICADYCNTTFGEATYTETFLEGGGCTDRLVLARRPVSAVASVVEGDATLVVETDYLIDEVNGTLIRQPSHTGGWGWPRGGGNFFVHGWSRPMVVVVYTAGYELLDGLPRAIERACIELTKQMWFSSSRDPAITSITIPGVVERRYSATRGDVSADAALPRLVTDALLEYKRLFA